MRFVTALTCFVLLICVARADDKDPYKAIAGKWTVTRMEIGGKVQDKSNDTSGEFDFGTDVVKFAATGTDAAEFKHELRPKSKPAEINLFANSKYSKLVLRGIYKVDGDTLTVCVVPGNVDRPTRFESTKDGGEILFVLQRKK
jgi:uncharacterized protein (TIGR03067 family)